MKIYIVTADVSGKMIQDQEQEKKASRNQQWRGSSDRVLDCDDMQVSLR